MKGRKPKDIALKLLSGNPGKRALPAPMPSTSGDAFSVGALVKPGHLDEHASAEWDRLVSSLAPILSPASAGMVLIACDAYSDLMQASKIIEDEGMVYTTVNKDGGEMHRLRPEVGIKERARRQYQQALAELGASPVAHTRVKKLPDTNQPELPGIGRFLG